MGWQYLPELQHRSRWAGSFDARRDERVHGHHCGGEPELTMLTYPQLFHFPIEKRRRLRTVGTAAADGRSVKLADPAGEITEWSLEYSDLSDDEANLLLDFFSQ